MGEESKTLLKQGGKSLKQHKQFMEKYAILIAFLLLCITISILRPTFLTLSNLIIVLNQTSINGILAVGITFVLITSGIDISIGSIVGLSGVAAALAVRSGFPLAVSFLIGILTGLLVGVVIGLLVTKGKLAPYIVTLGFLTIIRGTAMLISGGRPISGLGKAYGFLGNGNAFGVIPIPVIAFLICALIADILLSKLLIGRHIYAVGGNVKAAEASGINPDKIKMFVHIVSGTCAGIAGIILSSRIITGQPNAGEGYELDAIAAAVVGGTSLAGGTGGIPGTIVGALIIGVIANGLDLLGVSSYWQQIVKGLIIVIAVLLDRNKKRQ
jgi:ribose/xylose/arabinose/galactoside ABC-type transport system permease subunit